FVILCLIFVIFCLVLVVFCLFFSDFVICFMFLSFCVFFLSRTYTLNFTAARATCLFLNVTMATRAQMERAVQHGLETCRRSIAVVPRLTSNNNCGRGKTGLVTWSALADRKFNVFCFNASDFEETLKTSTTGPQSSTSSATLTTSTLTSRPTTPSVRSTPLVRSTLVVRSTIKPTRKPIITESPEQTPLTSAPLVQTTPSTRISSSTPSSLTPSSTHIAAPLPRLLTSKPAIVSFAFSTSGHASNISLSSESVLSQSVSSAKPSLGGKFFHFCISFPKKLKNSLLALSIWNPILHAHRAQM
uniref:Lymphatic vessel endothelial hyaluronic receptor 1b n=1 Tax=Amphiprion percula TaxID=161767 RepID=A0A3P8T6E4_AMPPE